MQVSKWGNSLAVRLPAELVEALSLKEGDQVDLRVNAENTYSLSVARKLARGDAIRELRKLRGTLPDDYEFDRDEANER